MVQVVNFFINQGMNINFDNGILLYKSTKNKHHELLSLLVENGAICDYNFHENNNLKLYATAF